MSSSTWRSSCAELPWSWRRCRGNHHHRKPTTKLNVLILSRHDNVPLNPWGHKCWWWASLSLDYNIKRFWGSWLNFSEPFLRLTWREDPPSHSESFNFWSVLRWRMTHGNPVHHILSDDVPVEPANILSSSSFVSLNNSTQNPVLQLWARNLHWHDHKNIKLDIIIISHMKQKLLINHDCSHTWYGRGLLRSSLVRLQLQSRKVYIK